MMKKLHIYSRVSTQRQSRFGYSLEAQKKLGKEKAREMKAEPIYFVEAGKSAATEKITDRPILNDLLKQCQDGQVTDIFVTELDRLTRHPATQIVIKNILEESGVILHTVTQTINYNNEDQEFMADIYALLNQRENKLRIRRSIRGLDERAKQGKWNGVVVPLGYKKDSKGYIVVDDEEKLIYDKIVKLSLEGKGTNSIARVLNSEGIPTKGSKLFTNGIRRYDKRNNLIVTNPNDLIWKDGTIYDILRNPMYKGERRYKGGILEAPQLISSEMWNKIQENLKRNKNNGNSFRRHFYMLKGLLTCNRCGRTVHGLIKENRGMRLYQCLSKRPYPNHRFCGMKNINIDKLNQIVWDSTIDLINYSEKIRKDFKSNYKVIDIEFINKKIKNLSKNLNEIKQKKAKLVELYESDQVDKDIYLDRLQHHQTNWNFINNEICQLKIKSAGKNIENHALHWLVLYFEELERIRNINSDDEKRKILLEIIDEIIVDYFEDLNEHVIEIHYKFPVYDNSHTQMFLLNGINLNDGSDIYYDKYFKDDRLNEVIDNSIVLKKKVHQKKFVNNITYTRNSVSSEMV